MQHKFGHSTRLFDYSIKIWIFNKIFRYSTYCSIVLFYGTMLGPQNVNVNCKNVNFITARSKRLKLNKRPRFVTQLSKYSKAMFSGMKILVLFIKLINLLSRYLINNNTNKATISINFSILSCPTKQHHLTTPPENWQMNVCMCLNCVLHNGASKLCNG